MWNKSCCSRTQTCYLRTRTCSTSLLTIVFFSEHERQIQILPACLVALTQVWICHLGKIWRRIQPRSSWTQGGFILIVIFVLKSTVFLKNTDSEIQAEILHFLSVLWIALSHLVHCPSSLLIASFLFFLFLFFFTEKNRNLKLKDKNRIARNWIENQTLRFDF